MAIVIVALEIDKEDGRYLTEFVCDMVEDMIHKLNRERQQVDAETLKWDPPPTYINNLGSLDIFKAWPKKTAIEKGKLFIESVLACQKD